MEMLSPNISTVSHTNGLMTALKSSMSGNVPASAQDFSSWVMGNSSPDVDFKSTALRIFAQTDFPQIGEELAVSKLRCVTPVEELALECSQPVEKITGKEVMKSLTPQGLTVVSITDDAITFAISGTNPENFKFYFSSKTGPKVVFRPSHIVNCLNIEEISLFRGGAVIKTHHSVYHCRPPDCRTDNPVVRKMAINIANHHWMSVAFYCLYQKVILLGGFEIQKCPIDFGIMRKIMLAGPEKVFNAAKAAIPHNLGDKLRYDDDTLRMFLSNPPTWRGVSQCTPWHAGRTASKLSLEDDFYNLCRDFRGKPSIPENSGSSKKLD
jgi:hypothetical protein